MDAVLSVSTTYLPSHTLNLAVIKENVPIYDRQIRITRDIVIGQENEIASFSGPERMLPIEGTFHYQAYENKGCFLPKSIPLNWTLPVRKLDTQHPLAELQRKVQ